MISNDVRIIHYTACTKKLTYNKKIQNNEKTGNNK